MKDKKPGPASARNLDFTEGKDLNQKLIGFEEPQAAGRCS